MLSNRVLNTSSDKRGITVTDNFPVLKDVQNNVILLNDSLVFYNALLKDCPFQVYNFVSDEVLCSFGDFPEASIVPETDADRDNICQSSSVYDVNGRKLISFYESIPIIRIYDMVTYELIREIRIVDSEKQIASQDDNLFSSACTCGEVCLYNLFEYEVR